MRGVWTWGLLGLLGCGGEHEHAETGPCGEIIEVCHDASQTGDEAAEACHEIGHDGDAAACEAEMEACLATCEAALNEA